MAAVLQPAVQQVPCMASVPALAAWHWILSLPWHRFFGALGWSPPQFSNAACVFLFSHSRVSNAKSDYLTCLLRCLAILSDSLGRKTLSEVGYQEALPKLIKKVLKSFNSCLAILGSLLGTGETRIRLPQWRLRLSFVCYLLWRAMCFLLEDIMFTFLF